MNIEQFEQMINELQNKICSMIEHPEQITLKNVQSLKLPEVKVNKDLTSRLAEYANRKINDKG
jgi:hypothetical protein